MESEKQKQEYLESVTPRLEMRHDRKVLVFPLQSKLVSPSNYWGTGSYIQNEQVEFFESSGEIYCERTVTTRSSQTITSPTLISKVLLLLSSPLGGLDQTDSLQTIEQCYKELQQIQRQLGPTRPTN
jgi:hypothetical protein